MSRFTLLTSLITKGKNVENAPSFLKGKGKENVRIASAEIKSARKAQTEGEFQAHVKQAMSADVRATSYSAVQGASLSAQAFIAFIEGVKGIYVSKYDKTKILSIDNGEANSALRICAPSLDFLLRNPQATLSPSKFEELAKQVSSKTWSLKNSRSSTMTLFRKCGAIEGVPSTGYTLSDADIAFALFTLIQTKG